MTYNTAHDAALSALAAGLSTIPPRMDGTKVPIAEWKQYQQKTPSSEDIDRWYGNGQTGIGLVCGKVSGNLECLDFDTHDVWEQYKKAARSAGLHGLLVRVTKGYAETTPNGFHLLYRCDGVEGNTKLAQMPDETKPNKIKTLVETRGNGGFIITAPSSGKVNDDGDYVLKAGGFDSIETITPEERQQLHTLAQTFDEVQREEHKPQQQQHTDGGSPGDEYIRSTTWEQVLEPHGWTRVFQKGETTHWRRPGKEKGVSATTNINGSDFLYAFTTSTVFDSERGYNRFSAYTLLNHNGDFTAAARELGRRGYGTRTQGNHEGKQGAGKAPESDSVIAPEPLHKEMPEPMPYPLDALGSIGAAAAKVMQRVIRAPDAICGQSVIAALAQIAQGHADISIDGRRRPTSCFFTSVAETGERKSAVDEVATLPHRDYEKELEKTYEGDFSEFEKELMAWKQSRDEGIKKCKTKSAKKIFLDDQGDAPVAPPQPVLLIEEPTYEGLIKILQCGLPSVGLFTDEGGRFIGGHAMNADNALKTAAGLSGLWDKGEAKRTRGGDGHSALHGKRLSMHLMLQEIVAEMMVGSEVFRGQGLMSRILISWPLSTVGSRPYVQENIFKDKAIIAYHSACTTLLKSDLAMNEKQELDPPILTMNTKAMKLWIPFHDYCDKHADPGGELELVRGLANKAPEHAVRLAGVLSVMRGASLIGLEELEAGIELMNYYLLEAIRIADAGQINHEVKDAATLLAWLKEHRHLYIYPAIVYQHAPIRRLREKKTATAAIRVLEGHGWLQKVSPMEVYGKRRRDVWRLADV